MTHIKELPPLPTIEAGLWRHWRGGLYLLPGTVIRNEATLEPHVLYYSMELKAWWSRPYADFVGEVPDLPGVRRFEHVGGKLAALVAWIHPAPLTWSSDPTR